MDLKSIEQIKDQIRSGEAFTVGIYTTDWYHLEKFDSNDSDYHIINSSGRITAVTSIHYFKTYYFTAKSVILGQSIKFLIYYKDVQFQLIMH